MTERIDTIMLTTSISGDNPVLHDLELTEGQLTFVSGKTAIAQKCVERLKFFKGEWYQNQKEGIPYFDSIFVKNPSLPGIRKIIVDTLTSVRGVQSVDNVTVELDKLTRILTVSWSVTTDGNETIETPPMVLEIAHV